MNLRSLTLLTTGAFAALAGIAQRADACGGFFCSSQPVVQTGEAIIFNVDRATQTVEATINISYQGDAQDFAWLLPLRSEPSAIDVGPSFAFQVAQRLTFPRFQITEVKTVGICSADNRQLGGFANDASSPPAAPAPEAGGGVQVLQKSQVGPYDTVVLGGKNADQIRAWLTDNGYRVTDQMMQLVVPYISQGDVLMALKLRKDQSTGDIQPIKLTMHTDETCVPIRLTAIAAQDDMQVLVMILSNDGRAIPKNYFHVVPNFARIDWLRGGNNYNQLISAAVDEGDGNAFTTEFAGASTIFANQIFQEGRIDLAQLQAATRIDEFLTTAAQMGLFGRSELRGILGRAISDQALAAIGTDRTTFNNCIGCFIGRFGAATLDAAAAAEEIRVRIVEPERKMQESFDTNRYFTRLNTFISPEEMNSDPDFSFSPDLPDVSNVHRAKMVLDCGVGGVPGSAGVHVLLEDGTTISFDSNGNPDRSVLDSMPAALKVEQLALGVVVRDNSGAIQQKLDEHNARNSSGCGCTSSDEGRGLASSLALSAILGTVLVLRRRRR